MQRTNIVSRIYSAVVIVPDPSGGLNTLWDLLAQSWDRCQSVYLYSPLNDGVYTDNTLPMLIGGDEAALAIGQPLLPGEFIYLDIESTRRVTIIEPSAAGTQLLVVTVSQ